MFPPWWDLGVDQISLILGWDYFQSLYYCFITLTTIGFGDFVALQQEHSLTRSPGYVVTRFTFFHDVWMDLGIWLLKMQLTNIVPSSFSSVHFSASAFFSGGFQQWLPLSTCLCWSSWQSPWRRWPLERKWKLHLRYLQEQHGEDELNDVGTNVVTLDEEVMYIVFNIFKDCSEISGLCV